MPEKSAVQRCFARKRWEQSEKRKRMPTPVSQTFVEVPEVASSQACRSTFLGGTGEPVCLN
jgi:hypothetical protein